MPPISDARFAEAHRKLLADSSIQFDMHSAKPPAIPGWLKWLADLLHLPGLGLLRWILLAIAAVVILLLLVRMFAGANWPWVRARADQGESDQWRPQEAPARALLQEADALAAQGRFNEAAHLLLFRSIEEVDSKRPQLVRPALTSRDIAAAPEIPPGPRGAFQSIVMLVERSLFGGRALDEGDWRTCRSAYEEFAFAGAWR